MVATIIAIPADCYMIPSTDPQKDSRVAPRNDSEMRHARSRTIPLPRSHIARTQSELQLSEDMAAAEWQDLCMFYRVAGGIRQRQQQCSNGAPAHEPPRHAPQHKPIVDWTGKDVSAAADAAARVTPFDNSQTPTMDTSSPPQPPPRQGRFLPYPQSLLLSPTTARRSNDGGWSITGFDEDAQESKRSPLAVIEQDLYDDDDAVFVMDL